MIMDLWIIAICTCWEVGKRIITFNLPNYDIINYPAGRSLISSGFQLLMSTLVRFCFSQYNTAHVPALDSSASAAACQVLDGYRETRATTFTFDDLPRSARSAQPVSGNFGDGRIFALSCDYPLPVPGGNRSLDRVFTCLGCVVPSAHLLLFLYAGCVMVPLATFCTALHLPRYIPSPP